MTAGIIAHYILPPIVGAVIGYFTNLIAVRMLFFPREEKYLFGHRVPFTPGAIPKGKARLAKAAGKIVQDELFTREDISGRLLTAEVERSLIDKAMDVLSRDIRETGAQLLGSPGRYDKAEESVIKLLTWKITDAVHRVDIPKAVREEGSALIHEQTASSPLLKLVITDKLIDRIMLMIGSKIEEFIDARAGDMVADITSSRIHDLGDRTSLHVMEQAGYDEEHVRAKLTEAYRESIVDAVNSTLKRIDVAAVVEDKINSMSVEELEKGVLMVMETELNMIVRLGALIGLVIGSINIFI